MTAIQRKITVLIPCHNEEAGVGNVIQGVPTDHLKKMGFETEVIVIDNNSNDNTAVVAQASGARVIFEGKKGKGNAIRTGFRSVSDDTSYVVMLDGDDTYKAQEIPRLIEPLTSDFCDVIVGSRLGGKTKKNAFRFKNRVANWIFTFLVRFFYKANVTDVLSGFFAWKKEVVDVLLDNLESEGFAIEMEMITKMKRLGFEMYAVPITYDVRAGETKLSAYKDGARILHALVRHYFWKPRMATTPAFAEASEVKLKKIAIVSDAVYPFNKGGKEKRIYEISTRLAAQGYDITIYTMQWWKKGEKTIVRNKVTLHAISPYYPLYYMKRRSIKQAAFFALHCFKLITKDFDIVEVDHIPHLVLFTVKIVCLLRGKQMIAPWHEVWGKEYWQTYLGKLGSLAYIVEKISVKLPNKIVSVSDHTTLALEKMLGIKNGIVTIPNGLDVEAIRASTPAPHTSDIVFAGRLLSHKNVALLLRAVARIKEQRPDITLLVVGDGPERTRLTALRDELDLTNNVSFLGFIENHEDLYSIMRASKVFALPSTREGFGIVVVEANACGLPVVTIDHQHNAARDLIINNENGRLCALDEADLADAILQLLDKPESPDFYVQYAEPYSWERILPNIKKAYGL